MNDFVLMIKTALEQVKKDKTISQEEVVRRVHEWRSPGPK
jgi:hypothetical protein